MHTLRIMVEFWRRNLLGSMEYRSALFAQAFGMMINNCFHIFLWVILFQKFPIIWGMNQSEYILLWAMASMGFGLVFTFLGGHATLATKIAEGQIENDMLSPWNPLAKLLAREWHPSAIGDIVFWILLLPIFCQSILSWDLVARLVPALFIATLLFAGIAIFSSALWFWMGDSSAIHTGMTEGVLGGSIYPMGAFDKPWIRALMYSVLPAALFGFEPFQFVLSAQWSSLAIAGTGALIWLSIALITWKHGLKRYESGNLGGFVG